MQANIGCTDKKIRTVIGASLISWAAMGGPVWAWIGIIPLLTAIISFCPFYALFGCHTCQRCTIKESEHDDAIS